MVPTCLRSLDSEDDRVGGVDGEPWEDYDGPDESWALGSDQLPWAREYACLFTSTDMLHSQWIENVKSCMVQSTHTEKLFWCLKKKYTRDSQNHGDQSPIVLSCDSLTVDFSAHVSWLSRKP